MTSARWTINPQTPASFCWISMTTPRNSDS